jgi:hypothetical protein
VVGKAIYEGHITIEDVKELEFGIVDIDLKPPNPLKGENSSKLV